MAEQKRKAEEAIIQEHERIVAAHYELERQEAAKVAAHEAAEAERLGLNKQQYQCKKLELEGRAHEDAYNWSTEQAAHLQAIKLEMEKHHAENAEKARLAQEQHNLDLQEQARLSSQQLANIKQERKEANDYAAKVAATHASDQHNWIEAHRLEMEKLKTEAAEKARIAQEQHNWEVQEQKRVAAEGAAYLAQQKKDAQKQAEDQAAQLKAQKLELEHFKQDIAEKARIAQEQHNWNMQQIKRVAEE